MKPISEKRGTEKLSVIRDTFREAVKTGYEHRAKDCATCETKGACCLDAHFVNVHVTRLEAAAINAEIARLPLDLKHKVAARTVETIDKYKLSDDGDTFARTYACPLFEPGTGCLVHDVKPLPCIAHACYERQEDLPPDEMLENAQEVVEKLNRLVYRDNGTWRPLPLTLKIG